MPTFPLRFSLATLFLLVTIVCLSAALWSSSRQLKDATEELEACRNELGYLTITDEARLHWIRVPQPGDLQWQWRIYVPEADRYRIWVANDQIPSGGTAKIYRGGISLPAGEVTVRASVYQDHNGDRKFRVEAVDIPGISEELYDMDGWGARRVVG